MKHSIGGDDVFVKEGLFKEKDVIIEESVSSNIDQEDLGLLQKLIRFCEVPQNGRDINGERAESAVAAFLYNDDLRPVENARRKWTWRQYIFFWVSGALNLNSFMIIETGLQLGLNWWQCWITIWVGYAFVGVFLVLGSRVGNIYHIAFPISSRIAFGTYFSVWVILNRVVMACVWYSTLAWLGGECIGVMLRAIFGNNLEARLKDTIPNNNLNNFQFLCFMLFWIVSMPFLWLPPHSLRIVFKIKSYITPFATIAFLIWMLVKANGKLATGSLTSTKIGGSALGWAVIRSIMSAMDNFSTLILNAPDFSRFGKNRTSSLYSQLFFLPLVYGLISLVGILLVSSAYTMYGVNYWNPLDILARNLDSYTSNNRAGVFLISMCFCFDQLASNLASNAIPAGTDMSALFPKFINIRRGSYICAAISLAICPWNLMASSSKFTTALGAYAVFLSAIAGVIAADYFVVRKGVVNLLHCYSNKPESFYMYNKWGTNWRALLAYIFGIIPNFPGFLGSLGVGVPQGAMKVYYLNYFTGYLISAISYIVMCYYFPISSMPAPIKEMKLFEEWQEVEDFPEERALFEELGEEVVVSRRNI